MIEYTRTTRVDKPWGHELIWAELDGKYVGKILVVSAGESLSLQYHDRKIETMYALSGTAQIQVGPDEDNLRTYVLTTEAPYSLTIPAGAVHRLEALEDSVIVEVSTADDGWKTDVVRLRDAYAREGTNAP